MTETPTTADQVTPPADPQNAAQAQERAQAEQSARLGDEAPAARTDPNAAPTGPGGLSLGQFREIAGGGKITDHTLDPAPDTATEALYFHKRYIASRLHREAGAIIARSPENIGFWGKGMTYHGNGGILVDIDTLEKHRFPDGFVFKDDAVYANSRDLPPSLVTGDVARNLSGESAQAMAEQRP